MNKIELYLENRGTHQPYNYWLNPVKVPARYAMYIDGDIIFRMMDSRGAKIYIDLHYSNNEELMELKGRLTDYWEDCDLPHINWRW